MKMNDQNANNIEWWLYMLMLITIAIGYLMTAFLEKKWNLFKKWKSWIVVLLPFIILTIIMVPLLLITPEIPIDIIVYITSFPTLFLFGFSTAIFLNRWDLWRERKLRKAREARGDFRKNKHIDNEKK